jgi:predicted MFS family arabinose efflux permease
VATYRQLFGFREYRYLFGGQLLSFLGDQLGAVAIAALVFGRTGSGLLTAVAYAASWLPGVFGGPILATHADRLPRRRVLIACDLARAALVALLALLAMPLWAAIVLLYVAHLWSPPFTAARSALMPEVLPGDVYILGNGLANITFQAAQVAGFAVGGIVIAVTGPAFALLADAATFGLSALLIAAGVRSRPSPARAGQPGLWRDFRDGVHYIAADSWLRSCLLLVWTASAFSFAVEGIAFPLATQLGGGARTAGLLLAASGVGFVIGALLLTRILPPRPRNKLLPYAAVLSVAVLTPFVLSPDVTVAACLLVAMGAGASFAAPLNAMFVRRVAPAYRGRAMGVATSGLLAVQGVGFLAAGAAVDARFAPSTVVGFSGIAGTAIVLASAAYWRQGSRQGPSAGARSAGALAGIMNGAPRPGGPR